MKLYHTGDREIRYPDIHHGRKNADFGWGFYLTPDREFTCRWAGEHAVVNEYELDESELEIRRFSRCLGQCFGKAFQWLPKLQANVDGSPNPGRTSQPIP